MFCGNLKTIKIKTKHTSTFIASYAAAATIRHKVNILY